MKLKIVLYYILFCTITTGGRDKKQSSVRVSFQGSEYFSQQEQVRSGIVQPPCAILKAELWKGKQP